MTIKTDEHGRFLARVECIEQQVTVFEGTDEPNYSDLGYGELDFEHPEPNVVTPRTVTGVKPILDLDFPCRLEPSTTEGRFHLYLDGITISDSAWTTVLSALNQAGIVQRGWAFPSRRGQRGQVLLRLPGVKKIPVKKVIRVIKSPTIEMGEF